MGKHEKKQITEYEESSGIIGKMIVYGLIAAFVSTLAMCVGSIILLIQTYHFMVEVSQKNDELSAKYEMLEQKLSDVENEICNVNTAIEENTAVYSAAMENQKEFVDKLYKSVYDLKAVDLSKEGSEGKKEPEKTTGDTVKQEETSAAADKETNIESKEETDPVDKLLNMETEILYNILENLRGN